MKNVSNPVNSSLSYPDEIMNSYQRRLQSLPDTHKTRKQLVSSMPLEFKLRRNYLFRCLENSKVRLARSLARNPGKTEDPDVRANKMKLVRLLLELHESPELGPPIPFRLGWRLEFLYSASADPTITLQELKTASWSWYTLAKLLESSLNLRDEVILDVS